MGLLMHPHDILKQYVVATEDGGMAWDKTYYLVFTDAGRMVVRVVKDFEQVYKTPDISEIEPDQFGSVQVDGTSLKDLVAKKLGEILPA